MELHKGSPWHCYLQEYGSASWNHKNYLWMPTGSNFNLHTVFFPLQFLSTHSLQYICDVPGTVLGDRVTAVNTSSRLAGLCFHTSNIWSETYRGGGDRIKY